MFGGCLQQLGKDVAETSNEDQDQAGTLRGRWLAAGVQEEHYMDVLEKLPTASEQKRAFMSITLGKGVPFSVASHHWSQHPLVVARREAALAKTRECQTKRAEARALKRQAREAKLRATSK